MIKNFSKLIAILLLTLSVSCNEDFVTIESDLSGAQNFVGKVAQFPVLAYSKQTRSVQVNDLPQNYLGVLKDDTYNTNTTASIITEIVPQTFNVDFGENPVIESVILNIPYFSTKLNPNSSGDSTYRLDSIFGNTTQPFKLSIHKSNYLLRDLDPATNFEEPQEYYSDAYTELNLSNLEGLELYSSNNFIPTNKEFTDINLQKIPPGLHLDLFSESTKNFWIDLLKVDSETTPEYLTNENNFKTFFKGLIIKAEPVGTNGASFIMLNLNDFGANISVNYTNNDATTPLQYRFNFNGITVNPLENSAPLNNIVEDDLNGDDNLYLRGFEGAFAVIDLFGNKDLNNNNIPDELEEFKSNKDKWLINEANLTFYVDNSKIAGKEPNRVVLYDLKNNLPIIDYFLDQSQSSSNPDQSRIIHSEPLAKDALGNRMYKLRLTEHINNIIIRDSTNTKLGLFVTNNIENSATANLKTPIALGDLITNEIELEAIPQNTLLNNKGTVLYGATSSVPEEKRVKFEIYYTEEN